MQHISKMPRLMKLAKRNRNGGFRVLFAAAALLIGTSAASLSVLSVLSSSL